ncbi:MAG: hypothetical protein QF526_01360 [Alphaproteobacteria bacterium]|nr:hypothetical protein [Alphaproteobacteria bacterium]
MHKPAGNRIDSLLASIEGLHAQANYADGGHQPSVAPDTAKSDVVHLDTVLARRIEENRQRPQASRQTTQKTPRIEEDDFDANLARLMQDITAQTPGRKDEPVLRTRASLEDFKKQETGQPRQTPYLDRADGDSPNDIRTEIDSLLAPYLDNSSSKLMALSAQPPKTADNQTKSSPPQDVFADIREKTIASLLTEEDLKELNSFIKQEIKHQISLWVAQNIEKIIEDSLLSATSKARNASSDARP